MTSYIDFLWDKCAKIGTTRSDNSEINYHLTNKIRFLNLKCNSVAGGFSLIIGKIYQEKK